MRASGDLAPFELVRRVGRGGQGEVWKARHDSGSSVAVKFLHPDLRDDPKAVERFQAEARIAQQRDGLGLLAVSGEHEGRLFFTMQWVSGPSLREKNEKSPLGHAEAARYVRDVALALATLHEKNLVHRDVKPSNIVIREQDDRAHLLDYGLTRDLTRQVPLTELDQPIGTPEYMSPEHINGSVDGRSDIFCLGIVFYELLVDLNPFYADTRGGRVHRILRGDYQALPDSVPRSLQLIIHRCLARNPKRRFQSARALADDLERYLEGRPVRARPDSLWWTCGQALGRHGVWVAAAVALGLTLLSISAPSNEFVAARAAGDALSHLQEWDRHLQKGATDPALARLLQARDLAGLQAWVEKFCEAHLPGETATAVDARGLALAQCPRSAKLMGTDYAHRDYYRGALALPPESPAYVSAVYQSSHDNSVRFALSSPLRDERGAVLGVLAVGRVAGESFENVPLRKDQGHELVVVGPWDPRLGPNAPASPPADALGVVVMHPSFAVAPSNPVWLRSELGGVGEAARRWLVRRHGDPEAWTRTHDTASVWYWDRGGPWAWCPWLAGLAPIGHTGLVVIVRSRRELWLVGMLAAVTVALGVWGALRHRRRQRVAASFTQRLEARCFGASSLDPASASP